MKRYPKIPPMAPLPPEITKALNEFLAHNNPPMTPIHANALRLVDNLRQPKDSSGRAAAKVEADSPEVCAAKIKKFWGMVEANYEDTRKKERERNKKT